MSGVILTFCWQSFLNAHSNLTEYHLVGLSAPLLMSFLTELEFNFGSKPHDGEVLMEMEMVECYSSLEATILFFIPKFNLSFILRICQFHTCPKA